MTLSAFSYAIGLMSGTSMDGVDAVCARFVGHDFDGVVAHTHLPFDDDLRFRLLALQQSGNDEIARMHCLARELGEYYARTVAQLLALPQMAEISVEVVGCHGQTVRHAPQDGYSVQLADWALLAEQTKLPVVGDFRAADLAADGQGAPLVPAFHHMLFAHVGENRAVVNIGGIANITVLGADGQVSGFDTGPGNVLMDAWVQTYFDRAFDKDGMLARSGRILPELWEKLSAMPYFSRRPPKSTGRDDFSLQWLQSHLSGNENSRDVLRTLLELTANSIADAVRAAQSQRLLLCGGGAFNAFLRERLQAALPNVPIEDTAAYRLPPMQVEAAAFAWLAHCCLHCIPANLPEVTGARGTRVLGALWRPYGTVL